MIKLIKKWSQVFNLPISNKKQLISEERMIFCLSLIEEEVKELKEGVENKDIIEIQDALGDILWVTIRKMMELGIDPKETIKAIYTSNMSKGDYSEEDALKTRDKYLKEGISTFFIKDNDFYITCRTSDNKVLKSCNFKEPIFK